LAKRLSEKEKEEIVLFFTSGKTIDEISIIYKCTKLTISRNLKSKLGEEKFKEFLKNNPKNKVLNNKKTNIPFENKVKGKIKNKNFDQEKILSDKNEEVFSSLSEFVELTPLDCEIENIPQKDLSSIPISEVELPEIVYMVVDKKIELETKYLKEYPDWQFLSQDELNRKTIEIFMDMKNAKRFCNKDQKVIKVPNTNVFKIVAPLLVSRGISRIVTTDKLIAL
tara:strand:+ start:163 stop:834 length:672 start_codon:yes stop_codon:yes gene_type:complete